MYYENLNGNSLLYEYEDAYDDSLEFYDDYDDYSDNEDDLSERRRPQSRRTRPARGVRGTRMGRSSTPPARVKGSINTPAGKAEVDLPPNLVTTAQFKELEAKVLANNKAILQNGSAISTLNTNTKRLDDGLTAQGRRLDGVNKTIAGVQQGQMFGALLPPKLQNVTFAADPTANTEVKVTSAKFDMLTTLLPLMFSGSMGGGSGTGGNNNMNMMLPMVILLSDRNNNTGTGNSNNSNDTTMLALVMMMAMNNNSSAK